MPFFGEPPIFSDIFPVHVRTCSHLTGKSGRKTGKKAIISPKLGIFDQFSSLTCALVRTWATNRAENRSFWAQFHTGNTKSVAADSPHLTALGIGVE